MRARNPAERQSGEILPIVSLCTSLTSILKKCEISGGHDCDNEDIEDKKDRLQHPHSPFAMQ
jgi:hypothetical protein